MSIVKFPETLFSNLPRKRFGPYNHYGSMQYGYSAYGDEDLYFIRNEYGTNSFGNSIYGDCILLSGIYQRRKKLNGLTIARLDYYFPKNPRYIPQQANRQKMSNAVASWQSLTTEQKQVYNERAIKLPMSGYNLYLREYLLSN